MRSFVKKQDYRISQNECFDQVVQACARTKRPGQFGTWINSSMREAYSKLHAEGIARSIEVWDGDLLVGGLYGLELGKIFFGESMFSAKPNTSKLALIHLAQELASRDFLLIDCQQDTPHMRTLGAELLDRETFWRYLSLNRKLHLSNQVIKSNSE